jgi:two-component system response regulator AtoC
MSVTDSNSSRSADTVGALPPEEVLFGCSAAMKALRQTVTKVATANIPVVIQGAGGTGKEVFARWIHTKSAYRDGLFVKVNCAAIPGPLLESELFGYEKGAFTGAYTSKPGRVELADKGTLFLDEISNLDLNLQGKLLHFLQDGTFCRIGDGADRRVDARVICATNKDLENEIKTGGFRADLYYRISVVQLRLPRLCDRREDIPVLAEYLRTQYEKQLAKKCDPFQAEVMDYFRSMNWPGNLRELSNEVARYVLIGPEGLVEGNFSRPRENRMGATSANEGVVSLKKIAKEAVREMERNLILKALRENKWNRRKTAQVLGISYRALIYKIREAGLSPKQSPKNPPTRVPVDRATGMD